MGCGPAGNFSADELKEVLELAKERGVKVYVTVNTYPRNEEMDQLPAYLQELEELEVDALIVAEWACSHWRASTRPASRCT